MNILGIETSCDETAAAVVVDGRRILSNVVATSLRDHRKFGGIIPEIASRRQLEFIQHVTEEALSQAGIALGQVDAVAVTVKPGLIGSLLVGTSFARSLSFALKKPFISVNHIYAHLYANFLTENPQEQHFPLLPAIGLVVSGGHTSLFHVKDFKRWQLIGQTLDDAVGETYDKVARMLDLGFPGGPVIDRLAQKETSSRVTFTCAPLPETYNFSFSGIKTAVLYYHQKHGRDKSYSVSEIVWAFQNSVVSTLVSKCLSACKNLKLKTLLIGGGVAANSALRQHLRLKVRELGINVYFPPLNLCTDNAAMIAGLAYRL